MSEQAITITIEPREDGGLRIWSEDLPGLALSHRDAALDDLGPALVLLKRLSTAYAEWATIFSAPHSAGRRADTV
jgi:hypothetical protein